MLRTVEATIDKNGKVKLAESLKLGRTQRAVVIILDSTADESLLFEDWIGPDEDRAWKHLATLPDLDE